MVERASPFAAPVEGTNSGISIAAVQRGSLWQVACWSDSFATVEAALADACGCEAPRPGIAAETVDGRLLTRIEPLKWWILGTDGADCPHRPDPDAGAWLDMSHDQAAVSVEGSHAAELLKRMVSVDLRPHAFPNLSFASTTVHHMFLKVLRRDKDATLRFELMVMRSYADDLREIVSHHLRHFPEDV